ncbi:mobilization protein [Helicobacter pylori]|uniref:mobilization protein n=1 Tax=Helicobacter pylori TaxID=210 RepID=UPI002159D0AC|nr:mobilization protein [Helicobacter pylori]
MGNLASGHFKPTNNIQEQHNDRTLSPSYLIPQEFRGQNEVNRPSTQAIELKERIIENAHQTYLITFKQKSQAKSYQWSLVVNIKTNTTMSDLEKLAEHFEIKYGFQCYQIAIHRDEGYMDENNQPHINHHAHMEFITLDKNTGKNRQREIRSNQLRQIQTEIAQILGMERGTDKRVSGTERIEPRKYAQMKNQERKKLEAKEKEIATALDIANTDFKEKIPTLQEAVRRVNKQAEILSATYHFLHQISPNYVSKITEKYKHYEVFNKTFGVIKKLKELYSKIVGKLFGDENAEKDPQEILNAITELQERPTKQQLEAKDKEIATLKNNKGWLNLFLENKERDLKEAQDQIETLESNETALKNDLNAKEQEFNTLKQEQNHPNKQATRTKQNHQRTQQIQKQLKFSPRP